MCEEISWIELPDGHLLFLTAYDLFDTPQGKRVREQLSKDDWCGHSAINLFFDQTPQVKLGEQKECTDFSNPTNFPHGIAEAIKAGKFSHFSPKQGLIILPKRDALYAEYQTKWDALYAEYHTKRDALYAEYQTTFWKSFANTENRFNVWK